MAEARRQAIKVRARAAEAHGMSPEQTNADDKTQPARSAFSFGGEDVGYFGPSVRAKAPGRSRARPVALGIAGLILLAAIVFVLVGARSGDPAGGGAPATPTPLSRAAYVTTQSPGFQFALSIDANIGAHNIALDGEGSMDERTLEGTLHMQIEGQQLNEIIKNPDVYVQLPAGTSAALAGAKPWIKANLGLYTQALGAPDPLAQNDSPTQTLALLDATGEVHTLGSEPVRGVATTHYHALVNLNHYAASVPSSQRSAMEHYTQQLEHLTGSDTLPVDVWVDAHQHVRRFSTELQTCTPQGKLTETVSMELYDFAPQPAVVVPAPSEVTDLSNQLAARTSHTLQQLGC
jgi:hypothetical protein